jgi:hypothetical protein
MSEPQLSGDFTPDERRKQNELLSRFLDQVDSRAKRNYSAGRLGPNDEGDLAVAVTADKAHNVVRIDFGKPVGWLALPPESCVVLIETLIRRLRDLGHPFTLTIPDAQP